MTPRMRIYDQTSRDHVFTQISILMTWEALFPGLDLDSGQDWTLDWTHGLWLNSALEHSLKPEYLVDALALCKSWILSINANQWCYFEGHLHHEIIKNSVSGGGDVCACFLYRSLVPRFASPPGSWSHQVWPHKLNSLFIVTSLIKFLKLNNERWFVVVSMETIQEFILTLTNSSSQLGNQPLLVISDEFTVIWI